MAGAVLLAIGDYQKVGVVGVFKNGLSIFGAKAPLQAALVIHKPGRVFIFLGANDRFGDKKALTKRIVGLENIVKSIRCYWVGPPNFGNIGPVVEVLRDSVKHCKFVDSTKFDLELQADRTHPTKAGALNWYHLLLDYFLGYR